MDLFQNDIDNLKEAYRRNGYMITNVQAENIWSHYSGSMYASWMMMGDDLGSLFELTKEFAKEIVEG